MSGRHLATHVGHDGRPPRGQAPVMPVVLWGGTRRRCLLWAAWISVPLTVIAVRDGRSPAYSIATCVVGALLGVGLGLWLSWVKPRLLAPRPPEGVSRWRIRQLMAEGRVPRDPDERAALARALRRSQSPTARVAMICPWALSILLFVGSVILFASQSMTGWLVLVCLVYPVGLVISGVEHRRASARHRYLLANLD